MRTKRLGSVDEITRGVIVSGSDVPRGTDYPQALGQIFGPEGRRPQPQRDELFDGVAALLEAVLMVVVVDGLDDALGQSDPNALRAVVSRIAVRAGAIKSR